MRKWSTLYVIEYVVWYDVSKERWHLTANTSRQVCCYKTENHYYNTEMNDTISTFTNKLHEDVIDYTNIPSFSLTKAT